MFFLLKHSYLYHKKRMDKNLLQAARVPPLFLLLILICSSIEMGYAGKASGLDYGLYGGSLSRNLSSESQSPGLSGSSNSAVGISESSSVTIQESECKIDSLNKPATYELPAFRHKRRRKIPVQEVKCPASLGLQNPDELEDDDDDPLLSSMLLNKNGRNSGEGSKIGSSRGEKRMRKPTQRYIEEFSDKKSKHFKGQGNFSAVTAAGMKDKQLKLRSPDELHSVRPGTLSSVPEEELHCETKIQVVSEFRARRGRPRKQVSISVGKLCHFLCLSISFHRFYS